MGGVEGAIISDKRRRVVVLAPSVWTSRRRMHDKQKCDWLDDGTR